MSTPALILYATVSGNAEDLAQAAAAEWSVKGRACVVENAADFPAARLREFDAALVIASTWGEGEAPPDAADFWAALGAPDLRLETLRYAVLALGSSSYRDFCGAGRVLDERLAARGARRLLPRRDCDTKFKADFKEWLQQVEIALDAHA
ncbi:MAG TPA: flavodoxin domain-containing protein [Acidobacteriota bacterium]|nr:flavodoxin domain-containing protein [Acidobacteriota bacterium]